MRIIGRIGQYLSVRSKICKSQKTLNEVWHLNSNLGESVSSSTNWAANGLVLSCLSQQLAVCRTGPSLRASTISCPLPGHFLFALTLPIQRSDWVFLVSSKLPVHLDIAGLPQLMTVLVCAFLVYLSLGISYLHQHSASLSSGPPSCASTMLPYSLYLPHLPGCPVTLPFPVCLNN